MANGNFVSYNFILHGYAHKRNEDNRYVKCHYNL